MKRLAYAILGLGLLAGCVTPEEPEKTAPALPGRVVKYTCASGGHLSVTYGEGKVTVVGETLVQEGSGQRWSWPSDGTHHIWELDGAGLGTLSLSAAGDVSVKQSACKADAVAG